MKAPLCIVTGVGDATGAAIVRRFVDGGYRVAMIARNRERLARLEQELDAAFVYPCDVGDLDALELTIATIKRELGSARVLVHNAVAHTFGTFLESDPAELERNFRVNTTALLYMARALAPDMIEAVVVETPGATVPRGIFG